MHLHEASPIANRVWRQLNPLCTIVNVAGDIRRCLVHVRGIDIVALPATIPVANKDLFGTTTSITEYLNPAWMEAVVALGITESGEPFDRSMKILLPEKIRLELFMPLPADYWRMFAIRSCSSDYTQQILLPAWVRKSWVATAHGLRLRTQCVSGGGRGWRCIAPKPVLPPAWSNEAEFFEWLEVPYVSPDRRQISILQ